MFKLMQPQRKVSEAYFINGEILLAFRIKDDKVDDFNRTYNTKRSEPCYSIGSTIYNFIHLVSHYSDIALKTSINRTLESFNKTDSYLLGKIEN